MVTVSELLDPEPSSLWTLVQQAGVRHVVALLPNAEQQARWLTDASTGLPAAVPAIPPAGERPWDLAGIRKLQQTYAEAGLEVIAIEDTPPMDLVRLGKPDRDEQIAQICDQIRAMGACGIRVLCYNWMAVTSWARTDTRVRLRGGALSTGYDDAVNRQSPVLVEPGTITEDQLWSALEYFLRAVVPVAEAAGVRLGLHPDDPPLAQVRGVSRIVRSVDAYRRVLELVDSPANAVTLCQGNFALMTRDLPSIIREFGRRDRIVFVHFRDVRGTAESFVETFHDEGQNELAECMRAYADVGFRGPLRPDHVPTLLGEDNVKPGYGALGRLFAIGYITGLRECAFGRHDRATVSG